jgi:hypothetical protein
MESLANQGALITGAAPDIGAAPQPASAERTVSPNGAWTDPEVPDPGRIPTAQ